MRVVSSLVLTAALVYGGHAAAEDIDLAAWSCKQFLSASKEDVGVILAWLDGYYKNEDDPPIIHTGDFFANSKKLKDYCGAHPDIGFIAATDALFERE